MNHDAECCFTWGPLIFLSKNRMELPWSTQ